MKNRIKAAFRTNDPQFESVFMLTALNVAVVAQNGFDAPWGAWALALLMWPTLAFLANLASPIPKPRDEEEGDTNG